MVKSRLISTVAFFATFFALSVIALGAFTRLIDAGLGCPDWPGCYGHFILPITNEPQIVISSRFVAYKAWAEMIHRYFVSILSLFILVLLFLIFKMNKSRSNIILAFLLLLLLFYQIMLGQWTVTLKLLPIIVTQHLLGGFFIVSIVWLIYLNNKSSVNFSFSSIFTREKSFSQVDNIKFLLPWAVIGLILLLCQITLGAWTSTNYASLSCNQFPWCSNESTFPFHFREAFHLSPLGINYEGGILSKLARQTIQMMHRLGALVFTCYMFIFSLFAMPAFKKFPGLLTMLYAILGLIVIQISLGMINIIFKLPLVTAIWHNLVAVILLLFMITFVYKLNDELH